MGKKLLYLVLTTSILALTGNASADLVARWAFNNSPDDQVGSLTWTLYGGASFSPDRQEGSASLLCDGVDDYATLPGSGLMSAVFSTRTVALWFKPNTTVGMQTLYDEGGSTNGLSIRINEGKLEATASMYGWCKTPLSAPLSAAKWSHAAISFDNGLFKLYLNGVEAGSATMPYTPMPAHTNGSGLGARNSADAFGHGTTGDYFGGLIDDVQMYSEALPAAMIQEIALGQANARQPSPANGAVGVAAPLLSWKPGAAAVFHNVYFGTDPNPPLVSSRQLFTVFYYVQGLKSDTTYYWRIDEIEADGTTHQGPVWKFMSEPVKNYGPTPADTTAGTLPGLVLTWNPGKGAVQYQVFFGPDQAAVASGAAAADKGKVSEAKFDTGTLGQGVSYFWRIDLIKADKSVVKGDVWSFRTADAGPAGKIKFEAWLDIGGGLTVADLTSSARYPDHPDTVAYLDSWLHPVGATGTVDWRDCYGSRMYGWLKPEQTGDYTFWIAGDDEQQLWLSTNDNPTNIKMIANVANWTPAQDFDNTQGGVGGPTQKSDPIKLEAGKKYFIMTLMKESYGGDSTAVAWQGPGIPARQILAAKYVDGFALPPQQPWSPSPALGVVDDFESYADKADAEIYSAWTDGYTDNSSGSVVGYQTATAGTYGETRIVHSGLQAMPLAYNNGKAPFYSEAARTFATTQDWTAGGMTDLSLWVRGNTPATSVAVAETGGKITLTGAGTDIWNDTDQFTFAYKTLTGDGAIVARVVSIGPGSNTWAKGGVMIRASLDGGSAHAMTIMSANSDGTAANGASFQYRLATDGLSDNVGGAGDSPSVVQPPYWVKMERLGDQITGYLSADGKAWRTLGATQTIAMRTPVYLGLCVTSHAWGEPRTGQFDSIVTTGNVSGAWQGAEITNRRHNSAQPLYVVVEDSTGKSATATNATAVNAVAWTEWKIPLSSLAGVNLAKVKKLYIGVGDRKAPVADGTGIVFIDDIRLGKP